MGSRDKRGNDSGKIANGPVFSRSGTTKGSAMDIPTIRLDFDLEPSASGRAHGERVRLPMLRQGADYSEEIGFCTEEGVFHDFTVYDDIVMTSRATVQSSEAVMILKKSTGELIASATSLTIRIPAARSAGIALPAHLPRVAGPQIVRFGHDLRLLRSGQIRPLAEGTLVMIYAFTR
jgi:hypothetical protein